jgi:CheY-like chemotaxis protein
MSTPKRKILVAEDSPGLARVVQFNLQHAGFDVTLAGNGQVAWELLQKQMANGEPSFEVVLSDQQMPKMTGTELCQQMRQTPGLAEIPFVLLTAKGLEMNASDLKATLGINRILAKPFSPAELVQVITDLLPTTVS